MLNQAKTECFHGCYHGLQWCRKTRSKLVFIFLHNHNKVSKLGNWHRCMQFLYLRQVLSIDPILSFVTSKIKNRKKKRNQIHLYWSHLSWIVSWSFLTLNTLSPMNKIVQLFCRISLLLDFFFFDVLSWLDSAVYILGRKSQKGHSILFDSLLSWFWLLHYRLWSL
jgi:hypothetical protein